MPNRVRWLLLLATGLASLTSGCDAGGSTGDPGVTDFTSITPSGTPQEPPTAGPCASRGETQVPRESWIGLTPISAPDGLWLDTQRGTVIDVSEPAAPRVRGRLTVGQIVQPRALGGRRLLARLERRPAGVLTADDGADGEMVHELAVLDFADPDAPRVASRTAVTGEVALLHVQGEGDEARVYVVSDEIETRCTGSTKQSVLRRYGLQGDAMSQTGVVELGSELAYATVAGSLLLLFDGLGDFDGRPSEAEPSLRLVPLSGDGALQLGGPLPAPGPLGFQPELWAAVHGGVLTFAARGVSEPGTRLLRLDVSDPFSAVVLSDCNAELRAAGAWFAGERVFIASWPAAEGDTQTNRRVELDSACGELSEQRGSWMFQRSEGRIVELDFSGSDALTARLLGPDAAADGDAEVMIPLGDGAGPGHPYNATLLRGAVDWDGERDLIGVPLESGGLQLLSVSDASVSGRAQLARGAALALPLSDGVASLLGGSRRELASFELDGDASGVQEIRATVDLAPEFARAHLLTGGYLLRQWVDPRARYADDGQGEAAAPSRLEVVAAEGDPERGEVLASIALDPRAQVVRAGEDLFLSIVNSEFGSPGQTTIGVHDFTDPLAPRTRGSLQSDALWLQDNDGSLRGPGVECLDCAAESGDGALALATASTLVLRGVRWVEDGDGHASFTFQLVDLSDPDAPALGEVFAMPDKDHGLGAFLSDDTLYYRYRRPLADGSGRVRFFLRRLPLDGRQEVTMSEPINLPGELVAAQGDVFYTVEQVMEEGTRGSVAHRCALQGTGVVVEASQRLGSRLVVAAQLRDRQLLLDLGPDLNDSPPIAEGGGGVQLPLRLVGLDASDLALRTETDIAGGAYRIGAGDGAILYSLWKGVLMLDAAAPQELSKRSFTPLGGPASYRGHVAFREGRAVVSTEDGGRLFFLEL
ncbi:MAG: hypothetical protein OEZ06_31985 [Myxococcales bacterium]|nr:hypothetical protein [Myxococcales bacterium]